MRSCVNLGGTTRGQLGTSLLVSVGHCRSSLVPVVLTKHPFSAVHSSRAIHAPIALGGSVYRNVESL